MLAGNQALGVNEAALVTGSLGTYLIVNDDVAGFQPDIDAVVDISNPIGALPSVGSIPVANFFV